MPASKASRFFERVDQREYLLCQIINGYLRYRFVLPYFRVVSRLGDGWFWYALILVLPILHPENGLVLALLMAATGLVCTLTYKGLKKALIRERPFISFPAIHCGTPPLDKYSFPSGHTLHAACFNTLLAFTAPQLALVVLPFTVSVAMSRVVLGLHYPSDVVAGAIIGGSTGALATYALPGFMIFA